MFKFITHRPLWVNILTGIITAVVIFFIFIFSLNWFTHHDQSKTVPPVTGKSFEEAKEILEKAGFEVEIQDSIYVDTTKPMQVLKQVPEADEVVKVNRTVYLTINRAVPPMMEMPNLVGFSYRSAEMALEKFGPAVRAILPLNLILPEILYWSNGITGAIIKPGTKIQMGSTIAMVLGRWGRKQAICRAYH